MSHSLHVLAQAGQFIRLYRREIDLVAEIDLKRVLLYAALMHDFGKIHPRFQEQIKTGRHFGLRHEILSLAFLKYLKVPEKEAGYLAAAIALHHKDWRNILDGSAASPSYFQPRLPLEAHYPLRELAEGVSEKAAAALMELLIRADDLFQQAAELVIRPYEISEISFSKFDMPAAIFDALSKIDQLIQSFETRRGRIGRTEINRKSIYCGVLARGLMICADHLASADSAAKVLPGFSRVEDVLAALKLETSMLWPHQQAAAEAGSIAALVAPTGSGKTESALLWAARLRSDTESKGRTYILLPYKASMNAMAERLERAFGRSFVALLHGKSLHRIYERLLEQNYAAKDALVAARCQEALARLNVAPIRVCSPYQLLKSFWGQKGYEAGLCSALGAQLVFDEIHAYDTPVTAMTIVAARFLYENFHARCLFMSATLPTHLFEVLKKYFPELSSPIRPPDAWLAGKTRHRFSLQPYHALSAEAADNIIKAAGNGSVLVVVNRVSRAIQLADRLRRSFSGHVVLLHSRFCQRDRSQIEKRISPRAGEILVATQVVEVSLDIDYDTGFFELAPLESLLQRCGRVNRKATKPPALINIFTEFDEPLEKASLPYDAAHLRQVAAVLQDFLKQRPDGIWTELDTQGWLDASYPEALKTALFNDIATAAKEFETCYARALRPFGLLDADQLKELQTQWDKLFDGFEVLPACFLEEAFGIATPLDAAQLLVPISGGQFYRLKQQGKLHWDDEIKEYVAACDYSEELGLII